MIITKCSFECYTLRQVFSRQIIHQGSVATAWLKVTKLRQSLIEPSHQNDSGLQWLDLPAPTWLWWLAAGRSQWLHPILERLFGVLTRSGPFTTMCMFRCCSRSSPLVCSYNHDYLPHILPLGLSLMLVNIEFCCITPIQLWFTLSLDLLQCGDKCDTL